MGQLLQPLSLVPRYIYVGAGYGFPKLLAPAKSLEAFFLTACVHWNLSYNAFTASVPYFSRVVCGLRDSLAVGRLKKYAHGLFAAAFLLD